MKKASSSCPFLLLVILPWVCACSGVAPQRLESISQLPESDDTAQVRVTSPYVLDAGDELSIQVWGFDELKRTGVIIDTAGEITYPLIGRVKLAGLTLPKAQELITSRLKTYIIKPQVDVSVTTSQRQQVAVVGEVNRGDVFSYKRPLTLGEAIAKAGWFNNFANPSRVILIRRAENRHNVFAINANQMLRDGGMTQPLYLQAGDIVYVPPRGIVKLERFLQSVQNIVQPLMTIEQAVVLWPAFRNALRGVDSNTGGIAISTPSPPASSSSAVSGGASGAAQ